MPFPVFVPGVLMPRFSSNFSIAGPSFLSLNDVRQGALPDAGP
jgi:hypothetical protein